MKRKLLVILGAGSSVEQDFPTTGELDFEMRKWARDFVDRKPEANIPEHAARENADYFSLLWANRENYFTEVDEVRRVLLEARTKPNYERVLGDLHVLMNGVLAKPYGDPLLKYISKADVFSKLEIVPDTPAIDELGSRKVYYAIQAQLHHLHGRLADRLRCNSGRFEQELENGRGTDRFDPYRAMFSGLEEDFEIGVYNLNYDTVALNALPEYFCWL